MTNAPSTRAIHRNVHPAIDRYRLPEAGDVSIRHRVSGALMLFLLMPLTFWMFVSRVSSEARLPASRRLSLADFCSVQDGVSSCWWVQVLWRL